MNHDETIRALKLAKQLWPRYYAGKDTAFHNAAIAAWEQAFKDVPYEHIKNALYDLAAKQGLHPNRIEVRNAVYARYGRPVDSDNLKRIYKAIAGEEWPEGSNNVST